ncbi:MAG: hypothetical protein F4Y03_17105 [Alphaproteobacteria bacterium]|nr:hypothetical protein [Alphaproteobacteria bacterium]
MNALAPVGLVDGRGTTREQSAALRYRILEIIHAQNPQSVRQIFYQMLDASAFAYVRKGRGERKVQRLVLQMRREGLIPWSWIVDPTRDTTRWDLAYAGVADWVDTLRDTFVTDYWANAVGYHIEIWCESRGMAGSIRAAAKKWRSVLVSFGGQPSDTLLYECAERINRRDYPTLVVYLGDLDPHGMMIEEAPRRKLREQWGCAPDWTRLLVTPDQIAIYDLPTDETGGLVQAEAFPVGEVFKLIDESFGSIGDLDEIESLRLREQAELDCLMDAAKDLQSESLVH